jgi:hypothetical protein
MGRPKKVASEKQAPTALKTEETSTVVHQWRIGLDKYSFNIEHWVQVPDEHGGTKFVQKAGDTRYCSTLEQLARGLRDTKFRAYFREGLSVQAAIEKSTADILAFFRGETEFIETLMETEKAQNLIRSQSNTDGDEEGEPEEDEEE